MIYIYIDESGDLGFDFSKNPSKHFLVCALLTSNPKQIEAKIRRLLRTLRPSRKEYTGTVHAYEEVPKTRKRVLKIIAESNLAVGISYINKRDAKSHMHQSIYNGMITHSILSLNDIGLIKQDEPISISISRRETNRFLREQMINEVRDLESILNLQIQVSISPPHAHKCLQLVDFCSWAAFRELEYSDNTYFKIIEGKVFTFAEMKV